MKCRYCGTNITDGAGVCPVCGKAAESGQTSSFQLKYTSRAAREEQEMRDAAGDLRQTADPYGLYGDKGAPGQEMPGSASFGAGGSFNGAPAGGYPGNGQPGFQGAGMPGFGSFGGQIDDRTGFQNPSFGRTDQAAIKKQKRKKGLLIFLIILEVAAVAGVLAFYLLDPLKIREAGEAEPPYAHAAVDALAENYVNYLGIGDFTQPLMEDCGGETAKEAYSKVVTKLEGSYGQSAVAQGEGFYLTGVCLLDLVDMDHDGIDELLAVCNEDGTADGYTGYIFFYEGGEVYRCFRAQSMITAWKQDNSTYMYVDLKDDGAKTLLYIGGQLEEDKSELECFVEVIQGNSALEKTTTLGPVSRIDGYKTEYLTAKAERDRCFAPFTVSYDEADGMRARRSGTDASMTSFCLAGDGEGQLGDAIKTTQDTKSALGL